MRRTRGHSHCCNNSRNCHFCLYCTRHKSYLIYGKELLYWLSLIVLLLLILLLFLLFQPSLHFSYCWTTIAREPSAYKTLGNKPWEERRRLQKHLYKFKGFYWHLSTSLVVASCLLIPDSCLCLQLHVPRLSKHSLVHSIFRAMK